MTVAATKCLTECGDVYGTRALWEQLRAALDEKLKGKPALSVDHSMPKAAASVRVPCLGSFCPWPDFVLQRRSCQPACH